MLVLLVMLLAAAVVVLVGVAEVMLVFDIDDDDDALEGCDGWAPPLLLLPMDAALPPSVDATDGTSLVVDMD